MPNSMPNSTIHQEMLVAMVRFNQQPASYMDPSWWQLLVEGEPNTAAQLAQFEDVGGRLSSYILKKLGLEDEFHRDFHQPSQRLVLVESNLVRTWQTFLGSCLLRSRIAQTVHRQQQLVLRQEIGEATYRYCLGKARFMSNWPLDPTHPPLSELMSEEEALPTQIKIAGAFMLGCCLDPDMPIGSMKRFALKLEADYQSSYSAGIEASSQDPELHNRALYTLLKITSERSEQWQHSFLTGTD